MKTFFTLIFSIGYLFAFAQTPDKAVGKATYNFVHIRDTAKRDKPFKETLVLLIGRDASSYKSLTREQQQEQMMADIQEQVKKAPDPNHISLTITGGGATSDEDYYQYQQEKKLYTEVNLINYYLINEPLPVIKWNITADTLNISGLHCQKATAHFKGRNYEAWFCPDLPFHTGPWKLNGLPGLIVQARDSRGDVQFNFIGFDDVTDKGLMIAPPADDIKASVADIERLKQARKTDPAGFARAAHSSGQARRTFGPMDKLDPSKIQSINVKKAPDSNSNVINNPLELPEGK